VAAKGLIQELENANLKIAMLIKFCTVMLAGRSEYAHVLSPAHVGFTGPLHPPRVHVDPQKQRHFKASSGVSAAVFRPSQVHYRGSAASVGRFPTKLFRQSL